MRYSKKLPKARASLLSNLATDPHSSAIASSPIIMRRNDSDSDTERVRASLGDLHVGSQNPKSDDPDLPEPFRRSSAPKPKSTVPSATKEMSAEEALEAKTKGNEFYKKGEYEKAFDQYSLAVSANGSSEKERAVALANGAAALLKLEKWEETVEWAGEALRLNEDYVKARVRRKEAREKLERYRDASEDAKQLGEVAEVKRLEKLADDKEKRDMDKAMGDLKNLGNSILGNFGMSLDDFEMKKDPNTGSYSVSMKK